MGVVDDADADAHPYAPVYVPGSAEPLTYVMSGGYGHTVGGSIAFAYLPAAHAVGGAGLEVEILGARRAARVSEQPLHDPTGARQRA
jgi:glycine cleavage system aminomethyltransferase T